MKSFKMSVKMLLVLLALSATPAWAGDGGASSVGGGGEHVASYFAATGSRVAQAFAMVCASTSSPVCIDLGEFQRAVQTASVLPRDQVFGPDGQQRDAINDRLGEIEISVPRVKPIFLRADQAEFAVRLVAHEYMGIARLEGSDSYQKSDALISMLIAAFVDLKRLSPGLPVQEVAGICTGTGHSFRKMVTECGSCSIPWNACYSQRAPNAVIKPSLNECAKSGRRNIGAPLIGNPSWITYQYDMEFAISGEAQRVTVTNPAVVAVPRCGVAPNCGNYEFYEGRKCYRTPPMIPGI